MLNSKVSLCLLIATMAFTLGAGTSACKKDETADDSSASKPVAGGMVTLEAKGKKIDPPVKKSQIPDGAWMCDMGTVHFAGMEKGAGTCDLCGMQLVQKGAEAAPAADEAAPAADEAAPAADEAAPAADEAAPAADQAEPKADHEDTAGHSH